MCTVLMQNWSFEELAVCSFVVFRSCRKVTSFAYFFFYFCFFSVILLFSSPCLSFTLFLFKSCSSPSLCLSSFYVFSHSFISPFYSDSSFLCLFTYTSPVPIWLSLHTVFESLPLMGCLPMCLSSYRLSAFLYYLWVTMCLRLSFFLFLGTSLCLSLLLISFSQIPSFSV